jgi:phage-related minor tail protein
MAGPIRISILANASNAVKGFKQTETASQRASRVINQGAKVAAAGFVAVGAGALKLAQGAAEDAAAQTRLATTLKNSAGATKGQVAATESWITAQGKALGVTDDELRPALGALATATGSVGKAQKLASLAMDISAGSGKSLESVTAALVRAQNGSVGGLSRLGIATKNAAGETKSFAQIQADMGKKFGGQAQSQAGTFAGKMKILKVQLAEAGESIGAMLLPFLTKMANYVATTVLPALQRFGNYLREHKTLAIGVGVAIAAFGAAFIVASAAMKVYAAGQTIVKVATKAWAATQWVLNAAMSANPIGLVVIAIAALVAGIVIAYKKSETFRKVVDKAWGAIKATTVAVWTFVKNLTVKVWNAIKATVSGVVNGVKGAVTKVWNAIKSATSASWGAIKRFVVDPIRTVASTVRDKVNDAKALVASAWNAVKDKTREAWQAVVGIVRDRIANFISNVRDIKGRVTGALSGIGSWLYQAGKDLIQGMVNGVKNMAQNLINAAGDVVGGAVKKAKSLLGINSPSKVFRDIGRYTVKGLAEGLEETRGRSRVVRAAGRLTTAIGDGFSAPSLAVSAVGAYGGTGGPVPTTVQITVNVPPTADKAAIGREVASALDAFYGQGGRRRA